VAAGRGAGLHGGRLHRPLDGQLARERGIDHRIGKLADPIADKALMGAALISLSALGKAVVVGQPW